MPEKKQISLRVTKSQKKDIIDKAKVLIEVIDNTSYGQGEAMLAIFDRFLVDYGDKLSSLSNRSE